MRGAIYESTGQDENKNQMTANNKYHQNSMTILVKWDLITQEIETR